MSKNPCTYQFKTVVQHVIDLRSRADYPFGVDLNQSPLYDLVDDPWNHLDRLHRKMIVVHQIIKQMRMDKESVALDILDFGCSYGEGFTLLKRFHNHKGTLVNYAGLDIDEDKLAIAREINPHGNFYRVDLRHLDKWANLPSFNAAMCADIPECLSHGEKMKLMKDVGNLLFQDGILVIGFCTPAARTRKNTDGWYADSVADMLRSVGFLEIDYFHLGLPADTLAPDYDKHDFSRTPIAISKSFLSSLSSRIGPNGIVIARKA